MAVDVMTRHRKNAMAQFPRPVINIFDFVEASVRQIFGNQRFTSSHIEKLAMESVDCTVWRDEKHMMANKNSCTQRPSKSESELIHVTSIGVALGGHFASKLFCLEQLSQK